MEIQIWVNSVQVYIGMLRFLIGVETANIKCGVQRVAFPNSKHRLEGAGFIHREYQRWCRITQGQLRCLFGRRFRKRGTQEIDYIPGIVSTKIPQVLYPYSTELPQLMKYLGNPERFNAICGVLRLKAKWLIREA